MENISLWQWVGSLILSGLGGYVGVRVAVVQLQTEMAVTKEEIKILRRRTHKHSTLITILAAKIGLHSNSSSGDEAEI